MADFGAQDVKRLRDVTGAGMMDAKKALTETGGDFEAAGKWLREQGIIKSAGRADRENTQGAIALAVAAGGTSAAFVQLKCETDFTAKSDAFTAAAQRLADAVLADGESAVESLKDVVDELKVTTKENVEVGEVVRLEAGDGETLVTYLHQQDGRGVNGVGIVLQGGTPELGRDIAMHAAFTKPKGVSRDAIEESAIAAEREVLEGLTRSEGKPEQAIPKIVEGRINAWIADQTLLEQKYVKDEKQTIRQLLGDAAITRFAQVLIGS